MWQVVTQGDQQAAAGLRADKLRNLSQRLDAAAGEGAGEFGGQIRSHPDVLVTHTSSLHMHADIKPLQTDMSGQQIYSLCRVLTCHMHESLYIAHAST